MNEQELELTRKWVEIWKQAGPELEKIRRAELKKVSTQQAVSNLADAFEYTRLHFKAKPSSGLVEQQTWFQRFRR